MVTSGIYQLRNKRNGKCYVGSSANLRKRWQEHLCELSHSRHCNQHLQRAFNKYGDQAFAFSVLECVEDSSQLLAREQHFLDVLKPEYNIALVAGKSTLGRHLSEQTKRKLSQAHMGKRLTDEHRRKLSVAHMGNHPSTETRRKMSEAWTPERRQRRGENARGKRLSEETRKKISVAVSGDRHPFYGKHHSEESKRKCRRTWTPGKREIQGALHRGKPLSAEHCRKLSMALTGERNPNYGKRRSVETRVRMSEAQKARRRRERATALEKSDRGDSHAG